MTANSANKCMLYAVLVIANLIYATESVFVKLASATAPASTEYFLFMGCAVAVLGIYAVIWQQIIARMDVSEAYMFKGTALIFVLIFSASLFGEPITVQNIAGAMMIVGGIILFSKL